MSGARKVGHVNLKVPPDYWEVTVYLGRDPVTNKRRYKSRCVRGTRKTAERALAQLVVDVGLSDKAPTSVSTSHVVGEYVSFCNKRDLSPLTVEGYQSIARGIHCDGIGRTPIDRLGPRDLDEYYGRILKRGRSAATARRHHSLLHASLQQACKWGWLKDNPADLATPPRERRRKHKLPTKHIVGALIDAAEKTRNPENAVAIRLAFTSSGRRGELCDRTWTDLNADTRLFWIHGSIAQVPGLPLIAKDTKDYQDRTILLDEATVQALINHRANQGRIAEEHGTTLRPDAYILANQNPSHGGNPDGSIPSRPDRITQAFRRIRKQVPGAETLRYHDLRHLSATALLAAGESLPNTAHRLGHRLETLARRYAHETDASAGAVDRMADINAPEDGPR